MSSRTLLQHYSTYLTDYEKQEVLDYENVFYINISKSAPKRDSSFDNDASEYRCELQDHLAYRYEILSALGRGSFGQVYKCFDHKEHRLVAVKILLNKKRLFKQGLIERKILETLQAKDPGDTKNIVRILASHLFRCHLLLVFELLSLNLY